MSIKKIDVNADLNLFGRQFHSGDSITVDGTIRDLYLRVGELCNLISRKFSSLARDIEEAVNSLLTASHIVDVTSSYTYTPKLGADWVIIDCDTLDKILVPSLQGLEEYNGKIIKIESDDGNAVCGLVVASDSYDVVDERNYTVKEVFSACADCLGSLED